MQQQNLQFATFAGGCFWGVQYAFQKVYGVVATRVGYTGGTFENPKYEDICTYTTGHAEAVEITFDPSKVSYEMLLDMFFHIHDPTQVNRQGPDIGNQYRSVIFYHNEEQRKKADIKVRGLAKSGMFARDIATMIVPVGRFWQAEDYHQNYFKKHGVHGCAFR